MKLAEALILRADYQKKIQQIRQRLINIAQIQDGETPAEDPQVLMSELDENIEELSTLIQKINVTNSQTELEAGLTIADSLAERDTLALKSGVYQALLSNASQPYNRYSASEIKYFTPFNIAEIQKQVDALAKEYRELDTQIQSLNWNTDLIMN